MQVPSISGAFGRAPSAVQPMDIQGLLAEMRQLSDTIQQRRTTAQTSQGPTLQETIARLRQQYPYASYEQLSEMARGRAPKGEMQANKVTFDKGVSDQGYGSVDDIMAGLFVRGAGGGLTHRRTKRPYSPEEARRYAEKIFEVQQRRTTGVRTQYSRGSMAGTPGSDPMSGMVVPPTPGATESKESFEQRLAEFGKQLDRAYELQKITHTEYERTKRELLVADANNRGAEITANSRVKVAEINAAADKYGTDVDADVSREQIAAGERKTTAEIENDRDQRVHEAELLNLKIQHQANMKEKEAAAKGVTLPHWDLYQNYLKTLAREAIERNDSMVKLSDDIGTNDAARALHERMAFYGKMGYSAEMVYQAVIGRYPNIFKANATGWKSVDQELYDKIQQLRLQPPKPLTYEEWANMVGFAPPAATTSTAPAAPAAPPAATTSAPTAPSIPAPAPAPAVPPAPAPPGTVMPDEDDLDMIDEFGLDGPTGGAGATDTSIMPQPAQRSPLPQKQTLSPEQKRQVFTNSAWSAARARGERKLKELIASAANPTAVGFAVRAALWDKYEELLQTGRTEDAAEAARIFAELMHRG